MIKKKFKVLQRVFNYRGRNWNGDVKSGTTHVLTNNCKDEPKMYP